MVQHRAHDKKKLLNIFCLCSKSRFYVRVYATSLRKKKKISPNACICQKVVFFYSLSLFYASTLGCRLFFLMMVVGRSSRKKLRKIMCWEKFFFSRLNLKMEEFRELLLRCQTRVILIANHRKCNLFGELLASLSKANVACPVIKILLHFFGQTREKKCETER